MTYYKNNWLTWSFENKIYSRRTNETQKFSYHINKIKINRVENFYKELCNNACRIFEENKKLSLFFSGGINSQIILKTYLDLKIPFQIIILKYSKNYNETEFLISKSICKKFNLSYKVLEIDIDSFFENDALSVLEKNFTIDPIKLILLKASTMSDDIPIIGNRFPYIYRSKWNYTDKAEWKIKFCEEDFIFVNFDKRKIIGDWFHFSPEIILSLLNHNIIQDLTSDKYAGRLSILSSRSGIVKNFWNDILARQKYHGIDSTLIPPSMLNFFNTYIKEKMPKTKLEDLSLEKFKSQIYLEDA